MLKGIRVLPDQSCQSRNRERIECTQLYRRLDLRIRNVSRCIKKTLSKGFIKAREAAKIDPAVNFQYKVYGGCTHDGPSGIPKPIYTDPEMIAWLFEQRAQRDWNARGSAMLQGVILKAAQKLH
jgi:hypothetical protein